MEFFLALPIFYLILFLIPVIVIPGIIFSLFIKKEGYEFSFGKSIFEIFIAKVTCSLIGVVIGGFIFSFLLFFLRKFGIEAEKLALNIMIFIIVGVYFFFYYKFLNSTLGFFIFDEEIRKKILLKFILISEIISSLIFFYLNSSLFFSYAKLFGINLF